MKVINFLTIHPACPRAVAAAPWSGGCRAPWAPPATGSCQCPPCLHIHRGNPDYEGSRTVKKICFTGSHTVQDVLITGSHTVPDIQITGSQTVAKKNTSGWRGVTLKQKEYIRITGSKPVQWTGYPDYGQGWANILFKRAQCPCVLLRSL